MHLSEHAATSLTTLHWELSPHLHSSPVQSTRLTITTTLHWELSPHLHSSPVQSTRLIAVEKHREYVCLGHHVLIAYDDAVVNAAMGTISGRECVYT